MKIVNLLRYAAAGWVAGVAALLVLTLVWPSVLPGFVNFQHYDPTGPAPNIPLIILTIIAAATVPALVGGVIGGQLPKEGGSRQQLIVAAIFGIILTVPLACFGLWLFSGA